MLLGSCGSLAMTKAFIIVNCILSILFFAVSIVLLSHQFDYRQLYLEQQKNYDHEVSNLKQEVANKVVESEKYQQAKSTVEEKYNHRDLEYTNEKRRREDLEGQLGEYKIKFGSMQEDIKDIKERLVEKEQRIAELEKEKDNLKLVKEEAIKDREEAKEEQQRLELALSDLQGEMAEKEKLLQKSEKELSEARMIIKSVQDSGVSITSLFQRTKPMNGQIVAVSREVDLVMLSVGEDEGVAKGDKFTVYRGSQFIGQVVVEEPYKDMSAARIIKDMTKKEIQKGDSVTTRIGGSL
jgi:predicted RNase H-like nuclease (RuvC/YqgF family)